MSDHVSPELASELAHVKVLLGRAAVSQLYENQMNRGLTDPEIEWFGDGWVPASVKQEVRTSV